MLPPVHREIENILLDSSETGIRAIHTTPQVDLKLQNSDSATPHGIIQLSTHKCLPVVARERTTSVGDLGGGKKQPGSSQK
mmetsp:Transcript_20789/g.34401  ORF Transcript_20789/g.34401 Transcript_20789/m.34401 type:complete len:81 (-) Transcript_20789:1753-1995(-)